jgi:hypothetical protein
MSPKSAPKPGHLRSAMRLVWLRGPLLFTLGLGVALLALGTYWAWRVVGPRVLDSPPYQLKVEQITFNAPPQWIKSDDFRREVVRSASLDRTLSIVDDQLAERIALAFAAHPWVEKVQRVEKFHPARVEVQLVYRTPVATVSDGSDLWPIDANGVLLPRENIAQADLTKFPRISGVEDRPAVRPGNVWQDMRVRGGAIIAAALLESWLDLGLAEIAPYGATAVQRHPATFKLVTRGGKQIDWGRQPLTNDPSEPSPEEKVKRLKSWVQQHGSLDGVALRPSVRK